ncbi:MAG: hypothetical protein GY853_06610 [PVC group bacterium]|nr:hypothetical protein [PVC group bacterium]
MNDLTLIIIFVSVIVTWLSGVKLWRIFKAQKIREQEQAEKERKEQHSRCYGSIGSFSFDDMDDNMKGFYKGR